MYQHNRMDIRKKRTLELWSHGIVALKIHGGCTVSRELALPPPAARDEGLQPSLHSLTVLCCFSMVILSNSSGGHFVMLKQPSPSQLASLYTALSDPASYLLSHWPQLQGGGSCPRPFPSLPQEAIGSGRDRH